MWIEFEWENRVNVNYPLSWVPLYHFHWKWNSNAIFISNAHEYLKHVMKTTNMTCPHTRRHHFRELRLPLRKHVYSQSLWFALILSMVMQHVLITSQVRTPWRTWVWSRRRRARLRVMFVFGVKRRALPSHWVTALWWVRFQLLQPKSRFANMDSFLL